MDLLALLDAAESWLSETQTRSFDRLYNKL
jgi:hypothetical protein